MIVVGDVLQTPSPDALQHLADVAVAVDDHGVITSVGAILAGGDRARARRRVVELGAGPVAAARARRPARPRAAVAAARHVPRPPARAVAVRAHVPARGPLRRPRVRRARCGRTSCAALLRHGTTTAVYFAANDEASTVALAAECLAQGQRAFVGRVAMDHPDRHARVVPGRVGVGRRRRVGALDRGHPRPRRRPRPRAPDRHAALRAGVHRRPARRARRARRGDRRGGADALLGVGLGARLLARPLRGHRHRRPRALRAARARDDPRPRQPRHRRRRRRARRGRGADRPLPALQRLLRRRRPAGAPPARRAACRWASAPTSPAAHRPACSPSASTP